MKRLLLSLLVVLPLAAQMRESVTVTVIEVPVTVIDRTGQSMRDLKKENFELYVDGKKTPITGFETLDLATIDAQEKQEPNAPPRPLPRAAYRNFVLLFDISNATPGMIGRAQKAAADFVGNQMKRRDLAAVATFSAEKGTQLLTSFTSDRELLQHVITNVIKPDALQVGDALRLTMPPRTHVAPPAGSAGNDRERSMADERAEAEREYTDKFNRAAEAAHNEFARHRIEVQFQDLGKLALLLDRTPGQKQILLLSEGFDDALVQGKKLTEGGQNLTERNANDTQQHIDRGEIWKVNSEERFGSSRSAFEIREMALLFKRSDVLLHAVDIRGLRNDVDAANGVQKTSNESLYLMTRPTGGNVFDNATDLRKSFDQMLRQQEFMYLLVFETKRTFEPRAFHDIVVKVPAARGGRVTHRAGFYEESPYPQSDFERTLSLAGMLMTGIDKNRNEVPLTITAAPLAAQANVPVVIEIPGDGLTKDGDENVLTADVYVYAFDVNNHIQDFLQQRLGVDLVRNGEKLRSGGLRYVSTLELPPGQYMLKALVRVDESGRLGLTSRAVTVPDARISATFLQSVKSGVNVAAPGRGEVAVNAFGTAVPVANPTLHDPARVAVFGGGIDPDTARFAAPMDGVKPALNVLEVADDRVLLELNPAGLKAGEYTLLLEGVRLPFRVE